jgi:hypothetical protein
MGQVAQVDNFLTGARALQAALMAAAADKTYRMPPLAPRSLKGLLSWEKIKLI